MSYVVRSAVKSYGRTLAEMVHLDKGGFYYRLRLDTPRQGPFATFASAVADAAWNMHEPNVQNPV